MAAAISLFCYIVTTKVKFKLYSKGMFTLSTEKEIKISFHKIMYSYLTTPASSAWCGSRKPTKSRTSSGDELSTSLTSL